MRVPFLLYDLLHFSVRFCASISYAERVAFLVRDLVIFLGQELIQDQVRGPVHGFPTGTHSLTHS